MPVRARGFVQTICDLSVADPENTQNVLLNHLLGNKNDNHEGDSIMAFVHTILEHVHNAGKAYPTLATSVQVTSSNVAHTLGVFREIVPVNGIDEDFDIHWVAVQAASANGEYELVLYAATTEIGKCVFARTDKKDIDSVPFQCAIQPANTQIQAKLSTDNAAGDTCNIKIMYHCY